MIEGRNRFKVMLGEINTPLSTTDGTHGQKMSKAIKDLNSKN